MCTNGRKADSLPLVSHKNRAGMSYKVFFIPRLKLEEKHFYKTEVEEGEIGLDKI